MITRLVVAMLSQGPGPTPIPLRGRGPNHGQQRIETQKRGVGALSREGLQPSEDPGPRHAIHRRHGQSVQLCRDSHPSQLA